ncbi:MAG TPA: cell division inhibitor [Flavobacteriales bacterium]|jgi:ligand-binding SRPBCC domain-containing protein|nr:cell division inhibitor [Flavobacteriales bacterium]
MVNIEKHSGVYTLTASQRLPISLEEAWSFLSDPHNLSTITPKEMGFEITSKTGHNTYEGQIITYKVGILPGIKSSWVTEIKHLHAPYYFVDEQRIGPYRIWYHEHILEETADGVLMKDKVTYKPPFGILGELAHPWLVKAKLLKIFSYREKVLVKKFGEMSLNEEVLEK